MPGNNFVFVIVKSHYVDSTSQHSVIHPATQYQIGNSHLLESYLIPSLMRSKLLSYYNCGNFLEGVLMTGIL